MKPSTLARRRASHTIIFGDPKSGKSTLVAELLMKGFHLTWISMDNGHEVIFKLPIPAATLDEQLDIIVIPDTKEQPVAIGTCLKLVSGKPSDICDSHGKVDCGVCRSRGLPFSRVDTNSFGSKNILVFDHLGQLANSAMNHIFIKDKLTEDDKPEWDHYYRQGTIMDKFLMNVQQASYNVVCIAHVAETEMEDGKKKLVPLVGTVPFSRNVGKYFDHMVHCEVNSGSHKFGSATTYKASLLTGSRGDFKIEDAAVKKEAPSLKIFFDGTVAIPEPAGVSAAGKVLSMAPKPKEIVADLDSLQEVGAETTASVATEVVAEAELKVAATAVPIPSVAPTMHLSLLEKLKRGGR